MLLYHKKENLYEKGDKKKCCGIFGYHSVPYHIGYLELENNE